MLQALKKYYHPPLQHLLCKRQC